VKNQQLLIWGLAAGVIALVIFVAGYAFVWNTDGQGNIDDFMRNYDGMMGGGAMGGMMGGGAMGGPVDSATAPITIDQAVDAANRYLGSYGNPDLKVREVVEFTNDYYVRVNEQSKNVGAFELLVNRNSGSVTSGPGPNLIWNTKYGMGSIHDFNGMMNSGNSTNSSTATTDMPFKKNDARDRAQKFLDLQLPGAKAGDPETFYGYYTVEVEKDGRLLGILSVDGYYGQVWWHSWHGSYLSGKKL